jgi:hypothetical protein
MDIGTIRSLRTKREYLRDTEAWHRKQRRAQLLRFVVWGSALAVFAFLVLD